MVFNGNYIEIPKLFILQIRYKLSNNWKFIHPVGLSKIDTKLTPITFPPVETQFLLQRLCHAGQMIT